MTGIYFIASLLLTWVIEVIMIVVTSLNFVKSDGEHKLTKTLN